MVISLSHCADEDAATAAAAYECKVESFTFDNTTQATACETLPTEINVVVEDLIVPEGKRVDLHLFATDDSSGYQVIFQTSSGNTVVYANLTGTTEGKTATGVLLGTNLYTVPQTFCIQIHDITADQHILVYPGSTCSGTALVDHEDAAASAATLRTVYYKGTDTNATLAELHITTASGTHDH